MPAASFRSRFAAFYHGTYQAEHRHPANIALHVTGTLLGIGCLAGALLSPLPWLALLFPLVHAAPGLAGHRLFERNPAVGDLRVTRRDVPAWWFLVANHRLTLELALAPLRRRS